MTDGGPADRDPFQIWLASSRDLFAARSADPPMADSLRRKCEGLFAAWNRFARTYAEAGSVDVKDGPFDPVGWLDAAGSGGFGDLWQWFGAPGGGDFWRGERDALTASRQWLAYTAALERFQALMGAAWLKAFERFAEELAEGQDPRGADRSAPPDWEAVRARWQEAAGAELAAAQRSGEFLDAQRDLIRARLDCTALMQGRAERLAGVFGLPTRAEIDELHETVHGLKRELRALRARLDGAE